MEVNLKQFVVSIKSLVSVIIINWNGKDYLKNCLGSLERISYKKKEIIVVDNGSDDGSVKFLRNKYPKVKIITNSSNLGFSRANNQGIKKARGEYILFLNNDTKVTKNFLDILVNKLSSDDQMGACQPKILHMEKEGRLDSIGSFLTYTGFLFHYGFEAKDSKKLNKEIKLFSGKGSCLLFKKKVLDRIGYFDEDFFAYFEETDLCWRLWLAGYNLLYIPEAVVFHKTWGTARKLPIKLINYHSFKNRISSLSTNLETKNLLIILPIHILICLLISFYYLFRRKRSISLSIIRALGWNIRSYRKIIKKRAYVQAKVRRVLDSEIFPVILKKPDLKYYSFILRYSLVRSKVFTK